MKLKVFVASLVSSVVASVAHAQGTFLYDQQSATDQDLPHFGALIQSLQPIGQSFTPTFFSVGFVQLRLSDAAVGNGLGATVYVNLWADSLGDGTLLGSTDPVFMPDSSSLQILITTFRFSDAVGVTPGTAYYFQPVVQQSGGDMDWIVWGDFYDYLGGTYYYNGAPTPDTSVDLWFREGIVVPEPSSVWLALVGAGLWGYVRRFKRSALRS